MTPIAIMNRHNETRETAKTSITEALMTCSDQKIYNRLYRKLRARGGAYGESIGVSGFGWEAAKRLKAQGFTVINS